MIKRSYLLCAHSQWFAWNSAVSPRKGRLKLPSGSGNSSNGVPASLLSQSRPLLVLAAPACTYLLCAAAGGQRFFCRTRSTGALVKGRQTHHETFARAQMKFSYFEMQPQETTLKLLLSGRDGNWNRNIPPMKPTVWAMLLSMVLFLIALHPKEIHLRSATAATRSIPPWCRV